MEGVDSDYGISDRQMQAIWDKFRDGNQIYEEMAGNLAEAETLSRKLSRGSRKMKSSITESASRRSEDSEGTATLATSADLKRVPSEALPVAAAIADARDASDAHISSGSPHTSFNLPDTVGGDYGDSRGYKPVKAVIVSSREVDKVTWYLMKIEEGYETRLYMKRYSDFKKLDQQLRQEATPGRKLLNLPTAGTFGIRHRFNLGDFNTKREQGLQRYLDQLLQQVHDLSGEKVVLHFLGPNALGRVTARQTG